MPAEPAPPAPAGGIRGRILEAALTLLRQTGIQGLSQVSVARRARVRQSHLTYYFPRRHDLLAAVSVRVVDAMVAALGRPPAAAADPARLLRGIARAVTEPGHMRMFLGVLAEADRDPALRAIVGRETRRLEQVLAERLGGQEAKARAGLTLASLWGLGLYELLVRPERGAAFRPALLHALTSGAAASGHGRQRV